jgi:histidyl-tRNA synthetase
VNYPATGVTVGLEPTMEVIKKIRGLPAPTKVKIFLIPINTQEHCIKISKILRNKGIKTMIDLMNKNVGKNLDYANKMKIPFVGILGENELKQNKIKIKNMKTGEEKLVFIEDIKSNIFVK